jgi:aminoglycoside 6'-N-acetyltransferase I
MAISENRDVLGWIGGIEQYDGNVWELHPLIVRQDCRFQGLGRRLVADFEQQVAKRGGHTLWLGTDDENCRTTVGGIDLYPGVLDKLQAIKNREFHPFEFYVKVGFHIVGIIPDANGFGKPDILMAKRVSSDSLQDWGKPSKF